MRDREWWISCKVRWLLAVAVALDLEGPDAVDKLRYVGRNIVAEGFYCWGFQVVPRGAFGLLRSRLKG